VTAILALIAPELTPVSAEEGESVEIRVPADCPITEWSVRAYDPSDLSKPGRELTAQLELTGVESVTFAAPTRDSIVEAFLRFGARGNATYYWAFDLEG